MPALCAAFATDSRADPRLTHFDSTTVSPLQGARDFPGPDDLPTFYKLTHSANWYSHVGFE